MRSPKPAPGDQSPRQFLWDVLTFDRLLTGPVVHLIYWAGLAIVVLGGFTVVGGAIGLAVKDGTLLGVLLAFPVLVAGLLVLAALALLWRGFCEFYVAVFRISEDLRAMRLREEEQPSARQGDSSLF
ncbi:MAG TPA: DUF4282 domain-containing protein [Caulobacteraceae bacterium]|nr:DUF4282 domain-containing protein [Caulobacteraceae bacterium]